MLTFVIPIKHPSATADPALAKALLAETLASIAGQTHPDWRCLIAAEKDADLPALPPKVEVVETDIPPPDLPVIRMDSPTDRQLIRRDKGMRIMTAMIGAQPKGHVMFVDYDDFVSCRLAALSAAEPEANGWYFDEGLLYSGEVWISRFSKDFHLFCGTSHIVHSRLLSIPHTTAKADPEYAARMLGSHVFLQRTLASEGHPLAPLPFAGAIYRVGHAGSTSRSDGLRKIFFSRHVLSTPTRFLTGILSLKRVTPSVRKEFFGSGDRLGGDLLPRDRDVHAGAAE